MLSIFKLSHSGTAVCTLNFWPHGSRGNMLIDFTLKVTKAVILLETANRMLVTRSRRGGAILFKGHRVSILQDEKIVKIGYTPCAYSLSVCYYIFK